MTKHKKGNTDNLQSYMQHMWLFAAVFLVIVVILLVYLFVTRSNISVKQAPPSLVRDQVNEEQIQELPAIATDRSQQRKRAVLAAVDTTAADQQINASVEWLTGGGAYILYASVSQIDMAEQNVRYQGWLVKKDTNDKIYTGPLEKKGNNFVNLYTSNKDHTAFDRYEIVKEVNDTATVVFQAEFN